MLAVYYYTVFALTGAMFWKKIRASCLKKIPYNGPSWVEGPLSSLNNHGFVKHLTTALMWKLERNLNPKAQHINRQLQASRQKSENRKTKTEHTSNWLTYLIGSGHGIKVWWTRGQDSKKPSQEHGIKKHQRARWTHQTIWHKVSATGLNKWRTILRASSWAVTFKTLTYVDSVVTNSENWTESKLD